MPINQSENLFTASFDFSLQRNHPSIIMRPPRFAKEMKNSRIGLFTSEEIKAARIVIYAGLFTF
jgi:hypothetical protein